MSGFWDELFRGISGVLSAIGENIAESAEAARKAHEEHLRLQEEERKRVLEEAKLELHQKSKKRIKECEQNKREANEAGRLVLNTEYKIAEGAVASNLHKKYSKLAPIDLKPAQRALKEGEEKLQAAASYSDKKAQEITAFEGGIDGCKDIGSLKSYSLSMPSSNETVCSELISQTGVQKNKLKNISEAMRVLTSLNDRLSAIDSGLLEGMEYVNLKNKLNSLISSVDALSKNKLEEALGFCDQCLRELKTLQYAELTTGVFSQINRLLDRFSESLSSAPLEQTKEAKKDEFKEEYEKKLTEAKVIVKRIKAGAYFEKSFRAEAALTTKERELAGLVRKEAAKANLVTLDKLYADLIRLEKTQETLEKKYAELSEICEAYVSHCADYGLSLGMPAAEYKARLLKSFDENNPERSISRIREDFESSKKMMLRASRESNQKIHIALAQKKGWEILTEEGSLDNVKRIVFCKKNEPRVLRILDIYASGKIAHMAVGILVSQITPEPIESNAEEVVSVCSQIAAESEQDMMQLVASCPSGSIAVARTSAPEHSIEGIYKRGYFTFDEKNKGLFEKFLALTSDTEAEEQVQEVYKGLDASGKWIQSNQGMMSKAGKAQALAKPLS